MIKKRFPIFGILFGAFVSNFSFAQNKKEDVASLVNVFLGTSADHGQMSPAASDPFSMVSIGPQTYPHQHTGYEYAAKKFDGFTHTRVEGVGCMGSGGNLLIKPYLGEYSDTSLLLKLAQNAGAGYYDVAFTNGITVHLAAAENTGKEMYHFPKGKKGFYFDLSHTLANGFVAEEHSIFGNTISGWIDAHTTCGVGTYRLYYYLQLSGNTTWKELGNHKLSAQISDQSQDITTLVGLSDVDVNYAKASALKGSKWDVQTAAHQSWNSLLGRIKVHGDKEREKLFYSLLYRTMQSPYLISEPDGSYRNTAGELKKSATQMYNGWSVWDNYKTQLPLLSLFYSDKYQGMVTSLANLYLAGKKDYATHHEPTNTVRTEHTVVVLLDAYNKGYKVPFAEIIDSVKQEVDHLDFSSPDKSLEYSYDTWALSEIYKILGNKTEANHYLQKALDYKQYWKRDFQDMTKNDVDRVGARHLYQGTIWQYRWFVPFDIQGLIDLDGGKKEFTEKLSYFFDHDLYNHANEPDIQVPALFNASSTPWRAQEWMHKLAVDSVVQYYFNDNSKGIDPFVDRIYKNVPQAYIRTMDDDAGANSAWFVLAACGIYPACVGLPEYYLNVPLFPQIDISFPTGKKLSVEVADFSDKNYYIQNVWLNGKLLEGNTLSQKDLENGGLLKILAGPKPNKLWGVKSPFVTNVEKNK